MAGGAQRQIELVGCVHPILDAGGWHTTHRDCQPDCCHNAEAANQNQTQPDGPGIRFPAYLPTDHWPLVPATIGFNLCGVEAVRQIAAQGDHIFLLQGIVKHHVGASVLLR